jgi:hypothetical protein
MARLLWYNRGSLKFGQDKRYSDGATLKDKNNSGRWQGEG